MDVYFPKFSSIAQFQGKILNRLNYSQVKSCKAIHNIAIGIRINQFTQR